MRKPPFIAALLAGLISTSIIAPAQAEVVASAENAFVTRDSTVVEADLRETWLALISPGKWWSSAHTFSGDATNMMLTPQAGGCFCERIPADDTSSKVGLAGSVEHMSVILAIPDQALRMRGSLGPLQSEPVVGIMTATLSKSDKGTRIVFEYAVGGFMRFEVPVISKAVDRVMSQQLTGLAEVLGVVEAPKGAPKPGKEPEAAEVDEPDADDAAEDEGEDDPKIEEPKISVDEAFGDLAQDN